jgi:hypothetical protein
VNPGLYGERAATNKLGHGVALNLRRTDKSLRVTADQSTASIGLRVFHVNDGGQVTLSMIPGFRRGVNWGTLRSVEWYFRADVSGQHIDPIFEGQPVLAEVRRSEDFARTSSLKCPLGGLGIP